MRETWRLTPLGHGLGSEAGSGLHTHRVVFCHQIVRSCPKRKYFFCVVFERFIVRKTYLNIDWRWIFYPVFWKSIHKNKSCVDLKMIFNIFQLRKISNLATKITIQSINISNFPIFEKSKMLIIPMLKFPKYSKSKNVEDHFQIDTTFVFVNRFSKNWITNPSPINV